MGSLLLKLIIGQLNQYILSVSADNGAGAASDPVMLGNIATAPLAGGTDDKLNNKVVVSLVNIAEEASLKNNTAQLRTNQQYFQQNPVVHVNLYLLFTANYDKYETAVNYLFRVLEFFQGNKIFKFKNAPVPGIDPAVLEKIADLELTVELHTLSFEQLNDLWGSLGGKQIPFVLYRARLVPIQMERITGRAGVITEIDMALTPQP